MNKKTSPKRIQRKRTRGWKMPDNTVYVGRPTIFGNPYKVSGNLSAHEAVELFREWLFSDTPYAAIKRSIVLGSAEDLKGKNLACWCKEGEPCHADVLLELANK